MKIRLIKSLTCIDLKLYNTLLLMGLIPTIYTTVRIFLLGNLPTDWGINIASQLLWIHIIYEVLQEAIMLPVFYLIGKSLYQKHEFENKVKSGLVVITSLYSALSVAIIILAEPMIILMNQKTELIPATVTFVRLETVASIFITLVQFTTLTLITIQKSKYLIRILVSQVILTIVMDIFLLSGSIFSLNIGVNGIAISNIIVNIVLVAISLDFIRKEGFCIFNKSKVSLHWMKEWFIVGGYSGLESLVRNLAFIIMVVRMVNIVGEQGNFWLAKNFIWGWLLLPVLQLGQLIKRDCGVHNNKAIQEKTIGYFTITGIIVIIWIFTIPVWKTFFKYVMNIENFEAIYSIAMVSLGFYVLFAFNNVVDSIFYGIGKTQYMLFQSLVINILFYGTLYFLYLTGIYRPDLMVIVIMFGTGIALDSLLTFGMFQWMLKKRNIRIFR